MTLTPNVAAADRRGRFFRRPQFRITLFRHFRRLNFAKVLLFIVTSAVPVSLNAQKIPAADDPQVRELYAQAKSAQAQGDLAGAAAKYEKLLQVAPNLGAAYINLGALNLQQREYTKAAAVQDI